jgi:hypothetical protein
MLTEALLLVLVRGRLKVKKIRERRGGNKSVLPSAGRDREIDSSKTRVHLQGAVYLLIYPTCM